MDRLEQALARARRHGTQVAVLCAKPPPGTEPSGVLVRECDTVTWLGDELLVVCGELAGAESARLVAIRTGRALGRHSGIGMAVSTDGCDPPERLVSGARAAMRRARGRVEADDELTRRRLRRSPES